MKTKLYTLVALAMLSTTTISFRSCTEEKYTVWTDFVSYSDFVNEVGATLDDGYYFKAELNSEMWGQISKDLTKEGRHRWTEEEIKKWLVSYGFGEYESTKEAGWFALINHGMLAIRYGEAVYMMLK